MADREHRRTVVRVVVVTQLCLALVTAVAVALAYRNLDRGIETLPVLPEQARPEKPEVQGPAEPLNILVMGSDSRDGAGNAIDGQTGSGARSDTTLLLHVSADRQDAYGVSLPRDAIVDRPACMTADGERVPGEDDVMFNTAFSVGGPLCTWQMVEALTGVRVDHAVTVDFNGFVDMVDAVGGVEVCIPKDVDDPRHDIYFEAGTQVLEGRQALNYVRERTVLSATGDIGRMKRQQAFIASMVNKVVSADTLTRPGRVYSFLSAATRSVVLDEGLDSIGKLVDLAMQFRDTGLGDIRFITVPNEPYPADPNRLQWTPAAAGLWKRMVADRPLGRKYDDGSISAADPVGTPSGSPGGSPGGSASGSPGGSPGPAPTDEERAEALAAGLCA